MEFWALTARERTMIVPIGFGQHGKMPRLLRVKSV
jgi:hypothetical protein